MLWDEKLRKDFEKIMTTVPAEFKIIAKEFVSKSAEKHAKERNAVKVEEADLMNALLSVTPEAFKPMMLKELVKVGIEVNKYTAMPEVESAWRKVPNYLHANTLHLLWQLTSRCHSRCIHCRVESTRQGFQTELSTEEIFRMIDNIVGSWDHPEKILVINFTGGEPLLRKDIFDILAYAKKTVIPKGHLLAFASDGYLITKEIAHKLKEHGVGLIFISLDSTNPQINDYIRGVKGAYEKQTKSIKYCKEAGILVIISCTVMRQNFDSFIGLEKFIEDGVFFYATGIIRVGRAHENWDKVGLTNEQYRRLYEIKFSKIIKMIREGKTEEIPLMPCFDMVPFMEIPRTAKERQYLEWGVGCQSCRCVMGIGIQGEVYPCEFVTQTVLGNLKKQTFKEIYESEMARKIRERKIRYGRCATCHHLDMCGGGCLVHNETITGNILGSSPYCWHDENEPHDVE